MDSNTTPPPASIADEFFRPALRIHGQVAIPDTIWATPISVRIGKRRLVRGDVIGLFAAFCSFSNTKRNGWVSASQLHSYAQTWEGEPHLSEQELAVLCRLFVRWGLAESRKRGKA